MAIEKLSTTPSLPISAAAGAPLASLPVQPSPFQALAPELQTHVFTCLPIGEYFRCMLVSTHWQRLVIALPGKRHDKFKMVVEILKEAKAVLQQVPDASNCFVPFLRLEASLDREQAKKTLSLDPPFIMARTRSSATFAFYRQLLPLTFIIDPARGRSSNLTGSMELIWVLEENDTAKREAVLQREVRGAFYSHDPNKLLGLLEVARKQIDPDVVKKLLHHAKEETLKEGYNLTKKEFLLRAVDLSLEIEPLIETKAFLARESIPQLKTQSIFQVAKRELQQFNTRYQTSGIIREVFLAFQLDFEGGVEFIEIMISYDLRAALLYMNLIQDPKDRLLALEAIFRRAVNQDLPGFKAMVEENPNLLFQLLGWLAIAKREWELGLPSAQETLEKVVLEQVPPEYHDLFLQRISRVKAIMNIDSSLTTVRLIQNDAMRLDALLYLAQLIANEM